MPFPNKFNCFNIISKKVKGHTQQGEQDKQNEVSCICNLCYRTEWDIEKQNGRKCICTSGFICSDCLNPNNNPDVINYQDVVNKCLLCSRSWGSKKETETSTILNPYHRANVINVNVNLVEVNIYGRSRPNQVSPQIVFHNNFVITEEHYFRPRDRLERIFKRKISDNTRSIINACLFIMYGLTISYLMGLLFTMYITNGNSQNIFTWIGVFGCLFFGILCVGCSNIISQCICRTCWIVSIDSWFLKTYDDGD